MDAESLLARASRMRSLARALCADAAGADDLVQDAFVAALEKGSMNASSPGGWIARVLANLSTDRRRSEAARRERERLSSRAEATPAASELVERAEVHRRLVECVLALPEPYREAVLERWFEERTPEEIARRLRIPSSTVRSRLQRGLVLLRERLEREEGRSWMAALAPLAATLTAGRPASMGAPAALSGGLLVSTGAKIAIGVGALAAATWIAWPESETAREPVPIAAATAPPRLEPVPDADPAREERTPALSPAPAATESEKAEKLSPEPSEAECEKMEELVDARTLAGIVLRGREPVTGGRAFLAHGVRFVPRDPEERWEGVASWMPPSGEEERFQAPIGRDGRFAFDGLQPSWYTLAIDVGGGTCRQMVFNLMRGSRPARSIVIVLGTAAIAGHVHDDEGAPIADARVVVMAQVTRNSEFRTFERTAWTDGRGAYELGELAAGRYHVAMRCEGRADDPNFDVILEVDVGIGERRIVDFGRPRALPVWDGIVRARTGEPAAGGGRIELEEMREGRKLSTTYDERGAFRVALLPGRYKARVSAVGDRMRKIELGEFDVPESGLAQDLVLPGTRIRGIALDARTGSPWGTEGYSISLRPIDHEYPAAFTDASIGPGGVFLFDAVGPGTWVLGGHPLDIVSATGDRVEVTVREGELEVPLTVTIGLRGK